MSNNLENITVNDSPSIEQRIQNIRSEINQEGDRWRQSYPILANQNFMAMCIFTFSVSGILLSAWAYLEGMLTAWLCIPLVAFFTSLLHELEHDLIHWQYFKNRKWLHHFMLFVGWLLRPGTINPWVRRHLHFLHHKVSGTDKDIEERGISNGMGFGPLRIFVMMDTFLGNAIKVILQGEKGKKIKSILRIMAVNFPFGFMCVGIWYSFLGFHGLNILADVFIVNIQWSDAMLTNIEWINKLVVILIAPFYLRSFSINVISSNMHYYGNVTNVLEQTQVLNHLLFMPFQLFCFNFGSTHGIHHFVVKEPFYIRQLTSRVAHKVMKENGVRFNDLDTVFRKNNYKRKPTNIAVYS